MTDMKRNPLRSSNGTKKDELFNEGNQASDDYGDSSLAQADTASVLMQFPQDSAQVPVHKRSPRDDTKQPSVPQQTQRNFPNSTQRPQPGTSHSVDRQTSASGYSQPQAQQGSPKTQLYMQQRDSFEHPLASTMPHHEQASQVIMQKRNIIFLGKTGAGKSTLANRIIGMPVFTVGGDVDSVTRSPQSSEMTAEGNINDTVFQYKMKLVDAVGSFSSMHTGPVMDDLRMYLSRKVPEGINLVIFVVRKGRLSNEERQTFNYIIRHFKRDIAEISALVITVCEGMKQDAREELKYRFKEDPQTKHIAQFMRKGIHTVGFPDIADFHPQLRAAYEQEAEQDTDVIRHLVANAGQQRYPQEVFQSIARPSQGTMPCQIF